PNRMRLTLTLTSLCQNSASVQLLRMTIMRARSKALNARQLPNNVRPRSPDDACRGSQEVFFGSAVGGPASMYPAFGWSAYWLLATMDISAHAISLTDRPQWAIWVTSVRMPTAAIGRKDRPGSQSRSACCDLCRTRR